MNPVGKAGGENLGGVDEGETVTRSYYMRKRSIFNKRKNQFIFNIIMCMFRFEFTVKLLAFLYFLP